MPPLDAPLAPLSRRELIARALAASAAVALLVATLGARRTEEDQRAAAAALWESSGAALRRPQAAARARRDPDPLGSRLALARLLFADALTPPAFAGLPPAEAAAEAEAADRRLALALVEANELLAARPTAWEAALVLGGARLVTAWRSGDADVYNRSGAWREPLEHAQLLAPAAPEPIRLLATGGLATWHALSTEERGMTRDLLRRAMSDPATLGQLLPAWATVAASPEELASVLPEGSQPFELLQRVHRQQREWEGFCAARETWRRRLGEELQTLLAQAENRLAVGDRAGGRGALLAVAAAPPDRRLAPLLARAVTLLPAGPVSPGQAEALASWLRWALPLWQLGKEPLPPAVIDRLAGLVRDLPPAEMALAMLAAGDLQKAELWERRSERLWSEEWARYAVAKAETLIARGHLDEAADALAEVHRNSRDRWSYRHARERLAAARGEPAEPAELMAGELPAAWSYVRGEAMIEVTSAAPAAGLSLEVETAPPAGTVIELQLDGGAVGCFAALTGARLRAPVELEPGPHLLVVREIGGERVVPGEVTLGGAGSADPVAAARSLGEQ